MIYLEKVYLSNWYGFVDEMIPFSNGNTFITGENESGKSTILDAIKYAFMADTQFNKGAVARGEKKRTLASYTRCLYNPSENLYARNEDTIFTYVLLGWFNDETNNRFTTGCIIKTKGNDTSTYWLIIEQDIEKLKFKEVIDGKEYVLSYQKFKAMNSQIAKISDYDSWSAAKENFMYRLGLHMTSAEIDKYKDEMRHMITYKAGSMEIVDFIKEFVLKEDPVNIDNLIVSKQKYDDLKSNMGKLEEEAEILKRMKESFDKFMDLQRKQKVNSYKVLLESCTEKGSALKGKEDALSSALIKSEEIDRKISAIDYELHEVQEQLRILKDESKNCDGSKQIEYLKSQIRQTYEAIQKAKSEISNIEKLYRALSIAKDAAAVDFDLMNLTDKYITPTDKEQYLSNLKDSLAETKTVLEKQNGVNEDKLASINSQLRDIDSQIVSLRNNVQVFDRNADNAIKLKNAINRRLEAMNKTGKAYLAAELVVELTDETWRNALESYVGNNRYVVLVGPGDYRIASEVQQELKLPYAKLINTVALESRNTHVNEESVLKYLRIENATAYKYFSYLLGNVYEATHETAFDHTPSLCKDLYYTTDLYSDYKEPTKINCLGMEAKKLNLQKKETEKAKVLRSKDKIKEDIRATEDKISAISDIIRMLNIKVNFYAYEVVLDKTKELNANEMKLAEIENAILNNSLYFEIKKQIEDCEKKESSLNKQRDALIKLKGANEKEQETCRSLIESIKNDLMRAKEALFANEKENPEIATIAQKEYDDFRARVREGKTTQEHSYSSQESLAVSIAKAEENLKAIEINYIKIYGGLIDSSGLEMISTYDGFQSFVERLNLLEIDKIQEAKRKVEEEQKNLNEIFKEQFVSEIFDKTIVAKNKLRAINKELAKMSYSTEYQFTQEYLKDGSDYETIIEYAKESQKTRDTHMSIFDDRTGGVDTSKLSVLNKNILQLIDRMTSKDADKDMLIELADYRNYLTYDIMQQDKNSGQKGYLSKEAGYNSGAGTQIPYTIILAVALVMEYNRDEGESTVRLIMLDEPFEKMSSENVKKTMELFRELRLQAILCGASKMDSIGENCGTVLPVLKNSRTDMQIGCVEIKENM